MVVVEKEMQRKKKVAHITLLLDRGWVIEEIVVTYVDCGGCDNRGIQTHENQRQSFFLERQVRNIQCNFCQKAQNQKEREAKRGKMTKVQYIEYERKNTIEKKVLEQEKNEISCSEYKTEKKKLWWNQEVVVHPIEGKMQQSGTQIEVLRSIAKEENKQRDIRRIFKILREV